VKYFERSGMSAPRQLDSDFQVLKFKRAAFYGAIKSKAGLACQGSKHKDVANIGAIKVSANIGAIKVCYFVS
jgi:hypothetical protein